MYFLYIVSACLAPFGSVLHNISITEPASDTGERGEPFFACWLFLLLLERRRARTRRTRRTVVKSRY